MSTDDSIYVNYPGVQQICDDLDNAGGQIGQVLDQLQQSILPLRATWSGASEAEYTQVQLRWNSDTQNMQTLLAKYSPSLGEISNNYNTTDKRIASQWAGI